MPPSPGRSTRRDRRPRLVERMNAEARRLGLTDTRFANPHGAVGSAAVLHRARLARLAQRLRSDFPQHVALFREREFTTNPDLPGQSQRLLWSDHRSMA